MFLASKWLSKGYICVARHFGDNTDDFARFAPFPCVLLSMPPPAQGRGSDKVSLGPRPSRDSRTKESLVSNVGILGCAESACLENG